MTIDEVVRVLTENVGRNVLVTPYYGPNRELGTPELLFILSAEDANGEGFQYSLPGDQNMDPTVVHQWQYYDVAEVQPA